MGVSKLCHMGVSLGAAVEWDQWDLEVGSHDFYYLAVAPRTPIRRPADTLTRLLLAPRF